jgi:2-(3-amino-3-carboxypropyl)histidine synthase
MQKLFIETKYEKEVTLPQTLLEQLPTEIILAVPVQFMDSLESIKGQLEKVNKKVTLFKSKHGKHPGQILGCDVHKQENSSEAFLYVGDGKFHPTALLYRNNQLVYCYNPFNDQIELLDQKYLETIKKRKKGQLAKFISSKNIGILATTKPGQNQNKIIEQLREKLENKDKTVYVFIANEINFQSLENFNFIESWINTACPRIVEDFKCLNPEDLKEINF